MPHTLFFLSVLTVISGFEWPSKLLFGELYYKKYLIELFSRDKSIVRKIHNTDGLQIYIKQNKVPVVGHQIKKLVLEYPSHLVSSALYVGVTFQEIFLPQEFIKTTQFINFTFLSM